MKEYGIPCIKLDTQSISSNGPNKVRHIIKTISWRLVGAIDTFYSYS